MIITVLLLLLGTVGFGQNQELDSLGNATDSIQIVANHPDSIHKKKSPVYLLTEAVYEADDSIIMDKVNQKAYLYHNAVVNYDGVNLVAEYIELDFVNNTVYAIGKADSSGQIIGNPIFKDAGDEYQASSIFYNFDTQKGIINDVTTNEGEIYVWLQKGKKMPDEITYVESGHFTTCNARHPHYRVRFNKGKIIPDNKIVTGPIYMEIEGIPIPLIIPFGLIPNTKGRSNGLLFPTYGNSENRGYSLTNGGYYWGLGPHADLALRADIYSKGSWGIKGLTRYNFRYRGNGSLDLKFAHNKYGETDTENYNEDQSFFVVWQHRQDPKANPNSNFSANVNFGSTQYNKLNSTNTQDYLANTFHSSISYNTKIGNGYNFTGSLNHSQNSKTGAITMTLPQLAFSTPRFNPFEKKKSIGTKKWYEKISMSYKMDAKNNLTTVDSLFNQTEWKDFDKGIQHSIPISSTVPMGNFTWTNSLNLNERWYFQTTNKYWESDTTIVDNDTIAPHLVTDKIDEFKAVHEFSYSSGLNTRIYGMYMFKKGPIVAMRHVLTPNLSFNYRPDFGAAPFNYFQEYTDANGNTIRYSMFEGQMYGAPADGKSGSVGLNFGNNFEVKIRSRKDTVSGTKKIKLLENLNFGTSYNLAAKEFALAPLSLTARTTLYKGISIRYASYWDFYGIDSTGKRVNEFIWNMPGNNFPIRKNSSNWSLAMSYQVASGDRNKKETSKPKYESENGNEAELKEVNDHPERYVDFNNAWNLNLDYTFQYTDVFNITEMIYTKKLIQTLGMRGSINVTEKWKIGVTTGWDFQANDLSFTSVDIYRDLHCWELLFNWIPVGYRKSYNLTIRVKSSMLQDLKLNRKRDWRDY